MSKKPIDTEVKKRIVWIAVGLFFLFSLLILQYYNLQIVQHERWAKEAKLQHQRIVLEPFKRGTFYSNTEIKEGHPFKEQALVEDVQQFHLFIDPFQIPDYAKDEIAGYLRAIIGIEKEDFKEFRAEFDKKSRSRKIAMWLDFETKKEVLSWWDHYAKQEKILKNSLFFVDDYKRSYPFGKLLGQVLHTIRDNKDELTKEGVPTGGLEMQFNDYLKGKQGKRLLVHSPRNTLEMGKIIDPPENGSDIYLTINHYLQAIAEEEIENGVKKSKAKSGWAVMMDPHTGAILALAQYPFFPPYEYREFFNDPKLIEHTKIKAVTDANEIGSVMKPITLACALLANKCLEKEGKDCVFSMNEKMATSNGSFPGRKKPLKDTHTHNFLNAYMAIQKSSNIYVARLVDRIIKSLGNEWYRLQLEEVFGFGQRTLIELPGEVKGLLPRIGKRHPSGALEWSTPTPYSLAMGHNIQATSLQILRAYAIIANGGFKVQPTIVKKIIKNHEVILDNTWNLTTKERVLDADIVMAVTEAMKYTTKTGGTARKANIWGYSECGKTGTAEKIVDGCYSKTNFFSSFIGFAPAKSPKFVLLVAIDEPEPIFIPGIGKNSQGGTCAAPIFREIGKRTLEYLGVPPDDEYGYPVGDPRYNADKADWIKETETLSNLYETWNGKH
jgi:cell division protein FtsI (penicillin-binding protein 3)